MMATPVMITAIPPTLAKFMDSWKTITERMATHTKLSEMIGQMTESSPWRSARIMITVTIPYSAYPANKGGTVTRPIKVSNKVAWAPMRPDPILIRICAAAVMNVEKTANNKERRFCSGVEEGTRTIRIAKHRRSFAALLQKFRDQRGPAGLMHGAEPRAVIAVKVFVKQKVVPEIRVRLQFFCASKRRAPAAGIP